MVSGETVGKLARAKSFSKRATSSKERSPNCSDNTAAIIVPTATASPCNQFPYPKCVSIAWPKVWPRFNNARSPFSVSSRATTSALIWQQRAMQC